MLEGKLAARAVVVAFLLTAALSMAVVSSARAAQVLVLGREGHVSVRTHRYVPVSEPVAPARGASRSAPRFGHARAKAAAAGATVVAALQSLYGEGQIPSATYTADLNAWNAALSAEMRLTGTPATELGAVIANINTGISRHPASSSSHSTPTNWTATPSGGAVRGSPTPGHQRLPTDPYRPLGLLACQRRHYGAGAVQGRQPRGAVRVALRRHQRLVALRARAGGHAVLSPARDQVSAAALQQNRKPDLLWRGVPL